MSLIEIETSQARALVKQMRKDTGGLIQRTKVRAGMTQIRALQTAGIMPPFKRITSFHTSTHRRNEYKDIHRFNRVMIATPKLAGRRFIYAAGTEADKALIWEAAQMATEIVTSRTRMYPKSTAPNSPHVSTGHLLNSIRTFVDGQESPSTRVQEDIANSPSPVFEITNIAEYASTAEARSYYFRQGALIFYAANRIQRRFPSLGVLFYYTKAQTPLKNAGYGHKYDLPVLRIGSKEDVSGKWSTPGTNRRRRVKIANRIRRVVDGAQS